MSKNPLWKISPEAYPVSIHHVTNACEAVYLMANIPSSPSQLYEFKDPDGDIGIEDFLELYVKAASPASTYVPRLKNSERQGGWYGDLLRLQRIFHWEKVGNGGIV